MMMKTKSLSIFTLVGVLASIAFSYRWYSFQSFIKNDLFQGEICEWDGVNCAKYVSTIFSNSNLQQAVNDNNANENKAASTLATANTGTRADDDENKKNPSTTNHVDPGKGQDKLCYDNVHPPGVVGLGVRDEIVRLTVKVLHFFIAKRQQYKYQPPLHINTAGPPYSPVRAIFLLTFAPSITLT